MKAIRYCKTCGLGPREWMECEEPDCVIETQDEANLRVGMAEYMRAMKEEVIPKIEADMRENARLAHYLRLGIPAPPKREASKP